MKNKLLSIASLLAVFNLNAIEIGPTGSGVELSGFSSSTMLAKVAPRLSCHLKLR